MQHKTYQCKIIIVPEEGWFGQPKYSTHKKDPSTLCRLLLLFSSFYMRSRLDHYIDPTYTSGIIVPVACLNVLQSSELRLRMPLKGEETWKK